MLREKRLTVFPKLKVTFNYLLWGPTVTFSISFHCNLRFPFEFICILTRIFKEVLMGNNCPFLRRNLTLQKPNYSYSGGFL